MESMSRTLHEKAPYYFPQPLKFGKYSCCLAHLLLPCLMSLTKSLKAIDGDSPTNRWMWLPIPLIRKQEVRRRRTLPRRSLPTKRRTSFEVACMVFNTFAGLRPARHLRCDFHISFGCISFRLDFSRSGGFVIQPHINCGFVIR